MNKIIFDLNNKILAQLNENFPSGLAHGKMGLCIYFFLLSRKNEYTLYRDIAEKILDDICEILDHNVSKDIESGLAGIALGVRFLIKEQYTTGNVEEILEDIDNNIYVDLTHNGSWGIDKLNIFQVSQLLLYLSIRLNDQKVDTDGYFIFSELIIKLINSIEEKKTYSLFKEEYYFTLYEYNLPFFLFVLSHLLKQEIYSTKIKNILSQLTPTLLSHTPILNSNKLLLLTGLLYLYPYTEKEKWFDYMIKLKQEINISDILYKELKNQDIFISNGVSGIFILLYILENEFPEWAMDFDKNVFYKRIMESEAWVSLFSKEYFFNMHRGIFNGITGVILILYKLMEMQK